MILGCAPVALGLTDRIADPLEAVAGSRNRAKSASRALLGNVLARMATGADLELEAFRADLVLLIDHFDPHR